MIKLVIKIINKPFIRSVAVLATGTAAAQAIGLLSSPVITRLYGPEAFGIMGVFMAIVQILVPIAALTYPIAIVLPKNDENAKKLIKLSLYIMIGITIIVPFLLLFFNEFLVQLFNIQEVSSYLFLIPIVIIFAGLMQVSNQWLIRTKQFGINAKAVFSQSFIINSGKIGIGIFYPAAIILVILSSLTNGVRVFIIYIFIRRTKHEEKINTEENQLSIKNLAKKYKDFPVYRAPEVLINAISQQLPVLMLTSFFGPISAGFYTLGNTVLQQPIKLIGQSVGDVFYPRITEAAHNKESITKLIKKPRLL